MKRLPLGSRSPSPSARKVACTVSAAALMLGVCPGATVGLHFMENYCGYATYSGYPVTMTAFGIAPAGWQNLSAMQTGYGSCSPLTAPYFYETNEVINTATSTNGLNPLPNGSLSVTWSANGANFSGFGGYATFPIYGHYGYDGQPPVPLPSGEAEIYSTFLRDGINFGVGASGGDNTVAPGYSVDITGLKSVFTNSPFVVQLIAGSDSIQYLTNAFIVDATATTTQSVTYASTPFPFNNEGGAPWFRGHAGGLSTSSGTFNTDHIQIMSNHPQHGTDATANGYNLGGTISGFILTDKPVVTMSPQPVAVGLGDTVTWSAYAIGVPPLSYQWLKNGVPIPGATTTTFGLTNVTVANLANYALRVTNLYGSATSSVVTIDHLVLAKITNRVADTNVSGTVHDGLNFGATWLASSTDSNGTNRTGVMSFNGTNCQIKVPAYASFNSPTGTVMFWMQTTQIPSGSSFPVLFDRYADTNGDGVRIFLISGGLLKVEYNSGANVTATGTPVNDGNWHHVALSYDTTGANGLLLYVDGNVVGNSGAVAGWSLQPSQEIELGLSHNTVANGYVPLQGLMDDFRFYNTILDSGQIASIVSSDALVDTNTLTVQLNFTAAPSSGLDITWQVQDGILQSATSITGPWTDVGVTGTEYVVKPSQKTVFYRYRGHSAATVVSNPYLM